VTIGHAPGFAGARSRGQVLRGDRKHHPPPLLAKDPIEFQRYRATSGRTSTAPP